MVTITTVWIVVALFVAFDFVWGFFKFYRMAETDPARDLIPARASTGIATAIGIGIAHTINGWA